MIRTRVPYVLYPHVSAGGEKEPLHRDEQQADDVWRECNANEKHRERLEDKKGTEEKFMDIEIRSFQQHNKKQFWGL